MRFESSFFQKIWHLREEMKVDGKLVDKFTGAITVELLKKKLIEEGFNVSNRDVYIKGVPYEIDLLILKKGERGKENLFYSPKQIAVVFEVKFSGAYPGDPEKIDKFFNSVKKVNKSIKCVYLAVSEDIKYKYYPEEKKLGDFSCFLLKRDTGLERAKSRNELKITGNWDKLTELLNKWKA